MLDRYNDLADTVPHEEYVLFITESQAYDGCKFNNLISEVKDKIRGDKLTIQEIFPNAEKANDYTNIIQNSVWVLHLDDCVATADSKQVFREDYLELQVHLKTQRYPDDAGVFFCMEDIPREMSSKVGQTFPELTIAESKDQLVGMLLGHFADANPVSKRGQETILSWNNDVCDKLGVP